jgi:hypothetical protein
MVAANTMARRYWSVTLESGHGVVIFKDGVEKKWYRQEYS